MSILVLKATFLFRLLHSDLFSSGSFLQPFVASIFHNAYLHCRPIPYWVVLLWLHFTLMTYSCILHDPKPNTQTTVHQVNISSTFYVALAFSSYIL